MAKLSRAQLRQRRNAGKARAKAFTPEYQSRAGKLGAKATIERYGMAALLEKARKHRLNHPSPLELTLIGILAQLKVKYEREYVVCNERYFTVDFWLPNQNLAIEVHGSIHDPGKPNYKRRLQNDQQKHALLKQQQRRLIVLHHSEFTDVAKVISKIKEQL